MMKIRPGPPDRNEAGEMGRRGQGVRQMHQEADYTAMSHTQPKCVKRGNVKPVLFSPIPLLTTQESSHPKFSSHLRQHLLMQDILSKQISLS